RRCAGASMTDSTERSVSFAQARAILARTSLLFRPYRGTIAVIVVTILVASGATLYERLKRMPLRFFTATRTGEIQSRLTNDVSWTDDVLPHVAQGLGREHRHPRQLTRRDARHELAGDHEKWRAV